MRGLSGGYGDYKDGGRGSLMLKEHEAACWLSKEQLDSVDWLAADKVVVDGL